MKKISILFALISIVCLVLIGFKSKLILSSISVGWEKSDTALTQLKSEINSIAGDAELKDVAITNAELEARSTKYMARYIVYLNFSLTILALVSLFSAFVMWQASNKLLKLHSGQKDGLHWTR
ncbi:hypothetical protein [Aurantivibrio infirmus]